MRILVACHSLVMSGGLMRFERFGREAARLGHRLAYLCFSDSKAQFESQFQQISLAEASTQSWDITMVPGQGFPRKTIAALEHLRAKSFGLRVQHILNDQTHEAGFQLVNKSLQPDLAVFNNRHWSQSEIATFNGRQKAVLEGAVDTGFFAPSDKAKGQQKSNLVIGAQAKNQPVTPLLEMLDSVPEEVHLRFFRKKQVLPEEFRPLEASGRVRFLGHLDEAALRNFYHSCDVVIHDERFAGWANMVAEAMACGVPTICTKHGTLAIAEHLKTAIVLEKADAESLSQAVRFISEHPGKALEMSAAAREHICHFDWREYTRELLRLCGA